MVAHPFLGSSLSSCDATLSNLSSKTRVPSSGCLIDAYLDLVVSAHWSGIPTSVTLDCKFTISIF